MADRSLDPGTKRKVDELLAAMPQYLAGVTEEIDSWGDLDLTRISADRAEQAVDTVRGGMVMLEYVHALFFNAARQLGRPLRLPDPPAWDTDVDRQLAALRRGEAETAEPLFAVMVPMASRIGRAMSITGQAAIDLRSSTQRGWTS